METRVDGNMWHCLFHVTFSALLIVHVLAYDYDEGEEIEDDICADQYENVSMQLLRKEIDLIHTEI